MGRNGWMIDKWVCGYMDEQIGWVDKWIDGLGKWEGGWWMDKWVGGQMKRWLEGWVCGLI